MTSNNATQPIDFIDEPPFSIAGGPVEPSVLHAMNVRAEEGLVSETTEFVSASTVKGVKEEHSLTKARRHRGNQ